MLTLEGKKRGRTHAPAAPADKRWRTTHHTTNNAQQEQRSGSSSSSLFLKAASTNSFVLVTWSFSPHRSLVNFLKIHFPMKEHSRSRRRFLGHFLRLNDLSPTPNSVDYLSIYDRAASYSWETMKKHCCSLVFLAPYEAGKDNDGCQESILDFADVPAVLILKSRGIRGIRDAIQCSWYTMSRLFRDGQGSRN